MLQLPRRKTMHRRTVIGEFGQYCPGVYYGHDQAVAAKLKVEREAALEEWRKLRDDKLAFRRSYESKQ